MFDIHDLTVDNPENQIIKHTAERLLRHFTAKPTTETQDVARSLNKLLVRLSGVNSRAVDASYIALNAPALIRGLPSSHRFYEAMLWLAFLISTSSGIVMERIGAARFETIILDASLVFERYVRRLIEDAVSTAFLGLDIFDGNLEPVPLFVDNQAVKTQPDYFFRRDGQAVAVADAKYKLSVSATDRYELLAFCEALGVSGAAFILPGYEGLDTVLHHGTTASGKRLQIVKINLSSDEIEKEEEAFIERLGKSLALI
jgi:5-methylcytosine-specific restriction endonuclease McrBC regulatory subunit McrC